MGYSTLRYAYILGVVGFASNALSQTPAKVVPTSSPSQSVLNQSGSLTGAIAAGTKVTVHTIDPVDSNKPSAGQFRGTVKTAVSVGNLLVPAGTNAVMRLIQNVSTNPHTWTLELTLLAVNGQAVPVSGGSPILQLVGSIPGAVSGTASNALNGILGRAGAKQQKSTPSTQNVMPAVSGTRVFVPAGSDVTFVVAQNTQQTQSVQTTQVGQTTQPGQTTQSMQTTQPGQTTPSSNTTVVYENIQYQLQSCQREAPHIICQIQITNLGSADAYLNGGQGSYYVDQAGNKVGASFRKIANCAGWGNCQLLPGVAMAGRFEFMDQEGHSTQLVRLLIGENGKAVAQFAGVPVQ